MFWEGPSVSKICVVGSINMDLVAVSDKRPSSGETIIGKEFFTNPGGKGANQAVAAARLGSDVTMLGCVGDDLYGKNLIDNLISENVSVDNIRVTSKTTTGIAHIVLAEKDNSIIVVPGANYIVDCQYIDQIAHIIKSSDMVLTQLEIPLESVVYLSKLCKDNNIPFLLNPAPAVPLPIELINNATYITPNESEAKVILRGENDLEEMMRKYPNKLILTLGENGVSFFDGEKIVKVPSIEVTVVDTTGAGDTFNGGFACGLCKGLNIKDSIAFANTAAGLSITKLGAQSGMPMLLEVMEKMGNINILDLGKINL
jgi:ribokinase